VIPKANQGFSIACICLYFTRGVWADKIHLRYFEGQPPIALVVIIVKRNSESGFIKAPIK
jgi:hypothetical protein